MTDLPEDRVAPHRAAGTGSRDALVTPLRRDPRRHGRGASLREHVEELAHRRHDVVDGDARATHRQHASGKLTARERIDLLLDPGTFCELESMRRHRAQAREPTAVSSGSVQPHDPTPRPNPTMSSGDDDDCSPRAGGPGVPGHQGLTHRRRGGGARGAAGGAGRCRADGCCLGHGSSRRPASMAAATHLALAAGEHLGPPCFPAAAAHSERGRGIAGRRRRPRPAASRRGRAPGQRTVESNRASASGHGPGCTARGSVAATAMAARVPAAPATRNVVGADVASSSNPPPM
jgi:Carboxyl transferase domain